MDKVTTGRRRILIAGALFGAIGVALGAFGAHGLRGLVDAVHLEWWRTGVDYQMWHAVALIALAAAPLPRPGVPALLIGLGTLVFSGTLYLMTLTEMGWLGAVTPFGGMLMILGWLLLAWRAARMARDGEAPDG